MRRQEQEANLMKEDLRQKAMEIRRLEKRLEEDASEGSRHTTRQGMEDRIGTKGALVTTWGKLKGRISRGSQYYKKKSLTRIHGDVTMERQQGVGDRRDLKSVSDTTLSGCKTTTVTTTGASAEYTVKSVHSYKECVHRSLPPGYSRRT